MKRLLTILLLSYALSVSAQTPDWLTTFSATETTKAQTNIQYAAYYADSSVLVFGNYGSLAATDAGVLGDQQFAGADYGTASGYNKNFLLAKMDKNGTLLWAVHSEDGDVNDSQSAVTITSDGGAVLALKFRHSDHNKINDVSAPLYKIVDASGDEYVRQMIYPAAWVNQPVLVRVNNMGMVTIVKDMWCSSEQAEQGTGLTTDAFTFVAAAEDEDGNIYIAGSQSLDMKIDEVTLAAREQPEWDGTTTAARYNGLLLKLDADLQYVAHISSEGLVQNDKPSCMAYADGKMYLTGLAKAEQSADLSIGDKTVAITELSVVNTCITTDLTVDWLTATPIVRFNNKQGNNLYQTLLSHDRSTLYVTGGMQGAVEVNGETVHSGGAEMSTMNDGYIYSYSTIDGSLQQVAVIGNTTLNLNHGVVECGDSLYVYNYLFGDIRQVAYDKQFVHGSTTSIATGGGLSTLVYTAALNGQVLLALRAKGGADFTVLATPLNVAGLWYNTLVAFHLEDNTPNGVETVAEQGTCSKMVRNGHLQIIRAGETYSILGQKQ